MPLRPGGANADGTGWSLDEVADAEMSRVRDSFGTMVVTEFGSGFLAGVHSGDSSATRVMGCPIGDVVNFSRDDDPAVVWGVVQGDLFTRDGACTLGGAAGIQSLRVIAA